MGSFPETLILLIPDAIFPFCMHFTGLNVIFMSMVG